MTGRAAFLKRWWSPEGASSNPLLADLYRAHLIAAFGGACAFGLGPFIIIAALVLHHPALGFSPVIAMIALSLFGSAAAHGFTIRIVLHLGQWTRGKRAPVSRIEHPAQFWMRVALLALFLAVKAAGAAELAYLAVKLAHL